ncbi:hypothetical protein B4U79_08501 [Dinothrombium tinctorium]|uniref:DUF7153 domain-containing protein n=1 Tax=Dinothrombium tinctorium TaxID=1965070 RepID=A0A3S3NHV1_9ACAR|nr:hypothetical protein B4U79_08501 [Dinothrombium tinctorium]
MNLLQRSISSQQSNSANQSQTRSTTHHKPTHSHTTNTHLLFHLNDTGFGNGNNGSSMYSTKPKKGSKSGGFPELNSNSTFDYYEYFSNYGRLLTTPPQSPVNDLMANDSRSTPPGKSEERGRRVSRKTSPNTSSPSSLPPLLGNEAAPLISPPSDPPLFSKHFTIDGASKSVPYRISFIETNVYIPVDLPSSPQHLPIHRRMGPNNYFHHEWVQQTVQHLKQLFKPNLNQILVNVEKKAKYPFIIFGSPGPGFDSAGPIVPTATSNTLSPELRITDGLYDICSVVTRPDSGVKDDDNSLRPLGYIISAFQTFPGEDSEKLEMNWLVWTGAGTLYKFLPTIIGLRRLIFYKRHDLHLLKLLDSSQVDNEIPIFTYVLICECFNLRESYLPSACSVIDQLRARCCGYSALYINQL